MLEASYILAVAIVSSPFSPETFLTSHFRPPSEYTTRGIYIAFFGEAR